MPGLSVSLEWTVTKSRPDVVGLKFWVSVPITFALVIVGKANRKQKSNIIFDKYLGLDIGLNLSLTLGLNLGLNLGLVF